MEQRLRLIEGEIAQMRCDACHAEFPHFVFVGEGDTDTQGLCSATLCGASRVAVFEVNPLEWKDLGEGSVSQIEARVSAEFGRPGLRVLRLLRVEGTTSGSPGMPFKDFKKLHSRTVVVYSCVCCTTGESKETGKISTGAFRATGGELWIGRGLMEREPS